MNNAKTLLLSSSALIFLVPSFYGPAVQGQEEEEAQAIVSPVGAGAKAAPAGVTSTLTKDEKNLRLQRSYASGVAKQQLSTEPPPPPLPQRQ